MAELYRTKMDWHPVEVNRLTPDNAVAVAAWCGGVPVTEHDALQHDITFAAVNVPTNKGMKRAQEGDWVIRYQYGNFDTFTSIEFETFFEAVVNG